MALNYNNIDALDKEIRCFWQHGGLRIDVSNKHWGPWIDVFGKTEDLGFFFNKYWGPRIDIKELQDLPLHYSLIWF